MAARLALAGRGVAPGSPDAVTITWLVPSGDGRGADVVCVVLVSLALDGSEAEAEGDGLREGDVAAAVGGAVEMTVAGLEAVSAVPVERRLLG